jgi:hypothetical protein
LPSTARDLRGAWGKATPLYRHSIKRMTAVGRVIATIRSPGGCPVNIDV